MDITLYIRLEEPPKGTNHAKQIAGKAVAKNWVKLNDIARQLEIRPLHDFVSSARTDPATLVSRTVPSEPAKPVREQWYSPAEALATIRKLMSRVAADKHAFTEQRLLVRDLQSFENILGAAEARGSRFHFAGDF